MSGDTSRLPCRGCTRNCSNYATCEGKPWRLQDQLSQSLSRAGFKDSGSKPIKAGESLAV